MGDVDDMDQFSGCDEDAPLDESNRTYLLPLGFVFLAELRSGGGGGGSGGGGGGGWRMSRGRVGAPVSMLNS